MAKEFCQGHCEKTELKRQRDLLIAANKNLMKLLTQSSILLAKFADRKTFDQIVKLKEKHANIEKEA